MLTRSQQTNERMMHNNEKLCDADQIRKHPKESTQMNEVPSRRKTISFLC